MVANFKKKKKGTLRQNVWVHMVGIFVIVILFVLVVATIKIHYKKKELAIQINSLKNQIESVKQQNETLQESIVKSDDSEYIEKIAREELDLQKEGEQSVSFIIPEEASANHEIQKKSLGQKWLDSIGNGFLWLKKKF